jgi:Fic family protein
LKSRSEYKAMMDRADAPRQGDLDGRGNLSRRALIEFAHWFLEVALDQVKFMSGLFEMPRSPGVSGLLSSAPKASSPIRGEIERGAAPGITGLPERTARRVLNDTVAAGLLASATPKVPVSLRFPEAALGKLFPRLYPQA